MNSVLFVYAMWLFYRGVTDFLPEAAGLTRKMPALRTPWNVRRDWGLDMKMTLHRHQPQTPSQPPMKTHYAVVVIILSLDHL